MDQPSPLEFDENGVPYYRWPPFPEPPASVTISPFKDYKPSGIQVNIDDNGVELDGEGIPTVQLEVKHDLDAPPRKKKKTRKTPTGEEVVKRFVWWEEWAAGEDLRRHSYDQMQNVADRISQAAVDFRSDREWPPASSRVQEWYDRFIYYIGLDNPKLRPKLRRFQKQEEPDEEVSDEDPSDKGAQPSQASQVKSEEYDKMQHKMKHDSVHSETDEQFKQRLERVLEAQTRRFEAFLNDPELAMKIFFSSYFRDGGMMWENLALRDAPRVVLFFLNFLLRNRTMVGLEKDLRAAVRVAEKARDELPKTKKIGANMPDELASCLTIIFGSRLKKIIWPTRPNSDDGDANEPQAKKPTLEDDSTAEFNTSLAANGIVLVSDDILPPVDQAEADTGVEVDGGGWSSIGVGSGNNWGDSTNVVDMDDNPWSQTQTTGGGWEEPAHFLMLLLGPTTLLITHTVGYVEESTRYVSSVTMPEVKEKDKNLDVGSYSDPFRHFARVVLKPYPVFATAERAAIQKPEILEDPLAGSEAEGAEGVPRIPRHDPEKDSILLLLDPKTAEELLRGMGLGGTFIQVVPDYASAASQVPSLRGRGKGGRGGHSDSTSRSSEEIFWYAEKILQVIPSFWTEKQI